jgi:predicted alpha/beta superfamily hydrolase
VASILTCFLLASCTAKRVASSNDVRTGNETAAHEPLVIGDSFTIDSTILGEVRRINVFVPTVYGEKFDVALPVLYMPDGGLDEDFLHIAGLIQVLVSDGSMRPFILLGIQNTQRRRDMTGPTQSPDDKKIAPVVGGSAAFRRFIKEELMPAVRARYRTTEEIAIVGESLAGLFVVETYFLDPELFGTYIAIDPSLWWNNDEIPRLADERLKLPPSGRKVIFLASSDEPRIAGVTAQVAASFEAHRSGNIDFHYSPLPAEHHNTIYHPAALLAFRTVFAPAPQPKK